MARSVGFDMGGVLGPQLSERKLPDGGYGLSPGPLPGSELIEEIVEALHGKNVYIVSRASSSAKVASNWAWLWHWLRAELADVPATNIFIFDAPRSEKGVIVESLGLAAMVDDRYEVLVDMPPGVDLICFCPVAEERTKFAPRLGGRTVKELHTWRELADHIISTYR